MSTVNEFLKFLDFSCWVLEAALSLRGIGWLVVGLAWYMARPSCGEISDRGTFGSVTNTFSDCYVNFEVSVFSYYAAWFTLFSHLDD